MAITRIERRPRASTNYALVGIAAVSLAVFALFAIAVWHLRTPIGLDDVLESAKEHSATQQLLAWLGSPLFTALAIAVAVVVAYSWRDHVAVAVCVVGPAVAAIVRVIAKPVVHRLDGTALTYPSGHATLAAAVAAVVVWLAYRRGGRHAALLALGPAAVLPLAVSVAVVRLGWHYPTDTIGGIGLGVGAVCATAVAFGQISQKWGELVKAD